MIYILEGNEGTGKTTLAEYLSKITGFEIKHRSNPKSEQERVEMYKSYYDDIMSSNNIIWDRAFYSEMVYGPIKRDQSYINVAQMHEFETMLAKKGALLIYCMAHAGTSFKRAERRGESYVTSYEEHKLINAEYEHLMSMPHSIPIVKYEVKGFLNNSIIC
jgi:thymidylate kinase